MRAVACVAIGLVDTFSTVMTRIALAFVYINLTVLTKESRWAKAGRIEALAVTGATVLTVYVNARVLVQFTMFTFILSSTKTLIVVDEVFACSGILTRG